MTRRSMQPSCSSEFDVNHPESAIPAAASKIQRSSLLKAEGKMPVGIALVILSSVAFAIGGSATKYLSGALDPTAIFLWRNFFSAAGVVLYFLIVDRNLNLGHYAPLHLMRGIATFAGLWTFFYALEAIPLATAVLLRTASPVFVPVVAYLIYQRHSDRYVWCGAWIGLVGVALVVEPSLVGAGLGSACGVASGIFGAVAAVLMWRLGGTSDSPKTQLLWLNLILAGLSLTMAPWQLRLPLGNDWIVIILIAAMTTASQLCLVLAFSVAPADKLITWGYLSVVIGAIIGAILWREIPNYWSVIGMIIIVFGSHIATKRPAETGRKI